VPLGCLLHKATPSRPGIDQPNTQKQIQKVRQNEEAEEYGPNERTRKKLQKKNYTKWKTLHSQIKFTQLFYVIKIYSLTILSNVTAGCINIGSHCLVVHIVKATCVLNSRLLCNLTHFSFKF